MYFFLLLLFVIKPAIACEYTWYTNNASYPNCSQGSRLLSLEKFAQMPLNFPWHSKVFLLSDIIAARYKLVVRLVPMGKQYYETTLYLFDPHQQSIQYLPTHYVCYTCTDSYLWGVFFLLLIFPLFLCLCLVNVKRSIRQDHAEPVSPQGYPSGH